MRASVVVAITLLVASGFGLADIQLDTDAGTGEDAPDTPAAALALADGSYVSRADSPKDVDWYAGGTFDDLRCVVASTKGTTAAEMRLGVADRWLSTYVSEVETRTLAIASSTSDSSLLGFLPVVNPTGQTASRPGYYGFEIARRPLASLGTGDANGGGDAGDTTTSTLALQGACTRGQLGPQTTDPIDGFHFDGIAGSPVSLSFASVGSRALFLSLYSARGTEIAEIGGDELVVLALPETGRYYLAVTETGDGSGLFRTGVSVPTSTAASFTSPTSYIVAFSDDPGGQGCRPMCLS